MNLNEYKGDGFTFWYDHNLSSLRIQFVVESLRHLDVPMDSTLADSFLLLEGNLREVEVGNEILRHDVLPDTLMSIRLMKGTSIRMTAPQ